MTPIVIGIIRGYFPAAKYPDAPIPSLLVCRNCPSCPPREAVIQSRRALENVDTGKFISFRPETYLKPPIGLVMGFCGVEVWTTASYSSVDDEGKTHSATWTGSYDSLTEEGDTYIGLLNGYESEPWWTLSGQMSYSFFRDLALGRLGSVEDEEWGGGLGLSVYPSSVGAVQARFRASFPPWSTKFGKGIRFAYRIALETVNLACGSDPPIDPERKKEWLTEDKETGVISITAGETEAFTEAIDDIPDAEDLSPDNQVQSKDITITGPSRKFWPTLGVYTVYANHFTYAFPAYDGGKKYYSKETATGAINASRIAGESWVPAHPILDTYGASTIYKEKSNGYVPPAGDASATSHTVMTDAGEVTFTLSNMISPSEAMQKVKDALAELETYQPWPLPAAWTPPCILASLLVGNAGLSAAGMKSKYSILITRPTLPIDRAGTVTARWKIHTITENGDTVEDLSESHTWEADDLPGDNTKTFGPYDVEAAEGELKWIEVLEPEEAQHVWPSPVWYVSPHNEA